MKTHGHTNSRTYRIWVQMRRRCRDPRHASYANYGGRGITVCAAWDDSFGQFLTDMGMAPAGTSIERQKNDRGYEPGNCIWATHEEQNNNRRNVDLIEHGGKRLSLRQWSREIGVNYQTLISRKRKGLIPPALLEPRKFQKGVRAPNLAKPQMKIEVEGQVMSLRQAAIRAGLNYATVAQRARLGKLPAEILSPTSLKTGVSL